MDVTEENIGLLFRHAYILWQFDRLKEIVRFAAGMEIPERPLLTDFVFENGWWYELVTMRQDFIDGKYEENVFLVERKRLLKHYHPNGYHPQ